MKPIEINKTEFEDLYYTTPNVEIAKRYNISPHTVYKIAKRLGIPLKGKGVSVVKYRLI